jgi:formate dehydrogenase major subunit
MLHLDEPKPFYCLLAILGDPTMSDTTSGLNRRDFLRTTAGGGFTLGGLFGLGLDLRAAQAEIQQFKIAHTREVPSVCPYCAVGCGQIVSVRDDKIINIEGNAESPISRGTLCPKGAATYQLAVNEKRITHVLYRKARGTEWERKPLEWAMDRIAELTQKTRNDTFQEWWTPGDKDGKPVLDKNGEPVKKRVNHTLGIASLGGATMDNEWNYVQCKLMRGLGVVALENQARI